MPDDRMTPPPVGEQRALSDADAIAQRIAEDEAAADAARRRLRSDPLQPVARGEAGDLLVEDDEQIWSVRRPAFARRVGTSTSVLAEAGVLFITDRRLVFQSKTAPATLVDLIDIVEVEVIGDRQMLVSLDHGLGLSFEIDRPRVFRVELSDRLAAARSRLGTTMVRSPAPSSAT
jgi:hypothetical protein